MYGDAMYIITHIPVDAYIYNIDKIISNKMYINNILNNNSLNTIYNLNNLCIFMIHYFENVLISHITPL